MNPKLIYYLYQNLHLILPPNRLLAFRDTTAAYYLSFGVYPAMKKGYYSCWLAEAESQLVLFQRIAKYSVVFFLQTASSELKINKLSAVKHPKDNNKECHPEINIPSHPR